MSTPFFCTNVYVVALEAAFISQPFQPPNIINYIFQFHSVFRSHFYQMKATFSFYYLLFRITTGKKREQGRNSSIDTKRCTHCLTWLVRFQFTYVLPLTTCSMSILSWKPSIPDKANCNFYCKMLIHHVRRTWLHHCTITFCGVLCDCHSVLRMEIFWCFASTLSMHVAENNSSAKGKGIEMYCVPASTRANSPKQFDCWPWLAQKALFHLHALPAQKKWP